MHRHVHGPLHGLLQPRVQGLRRETAEREQQHVSHLEGQDRGLCMHSFGKCRGLKFSHLPEPQEGTE